MGCENCPKNAKNQEVGEKDSTKKCSIYDEDPIGMLTTVLSLMLPLANSSSTDPDEYAHLQARIEMLEDEVSKMKKLLLR